MTQLLEKEQRDHESGIGRLGGRGGVGLSGGEARDAKENPSCKGGPVDGNWIAMGGTFGWGEQPHGDGGQAPAVHMRGAGHLGPSFV